jgi:hypothetical protein
MARQSDKIVKGAQEYLEANAASGAPALAEAFERVRAVSA